MNHAVTRSVTRFPYAAQAASRNPLRRKGVTLRVTTYFGWIPGASPRMTAGGDGHPHREGITLRVTTYFGWIPGASPRMTAKGVRAPVPCHYIPTVILAEGGDPVIKLKGVSPCHCCFSVTPPSQPVILAEGGDPVIKLKGANPLSLQRHKPPRTTSFAAKESRYTPSSSPKAGIQLLNSRALVSPCHFGGFAAKESRYA